MTQCYHTIVASLTVKKKTNIVIRVIQKSNKKQVMHLL